MSAGQVGARTAPRTLWHAELVGVRVISLKNHKQVIKVRGRTLLVPSVAHEKFLWLAAPQLRQVAPATPLAVPYVLTVRFALKGRLDIDLDNAVTTIADLLMTAGIVADDALCVRLVADKIPGAPDWHTTITIAEVAA